MGSIEQKRKGGDVGEKQYGRILCHMEKQRREKWDAVSSPGFTVSPHGKVAKTGDGESCQKRGGKENCHRNKGGMMVANKRAQESKTRESSGR